METNTNKNLIWKIAVPTVAVLLVLGIVIYTGGFGNFLKLLGIKASELQTIELSSRDQLSGNSPTDNWLVQGSTPIVDGTGTFDAFTGIPNDPDTLGFVMPIYSSADETNTYTTHTYISPAIDLGADAPTLSSYGVTEHLSEGGSITYSYRTSDTLDGILAATFSTVDLAADSANSDIMTAKLDLATSVSRYIQVKAEFINDSFTNRSAVYGWKLQYDANQVTAAGTDTNTITDTTTGVQLVPVTLDFTATKNLPETISIQILTSSAQGSQEVVSYNNLATADITPLYNLPMSLPPSHYAIVVRGAGIEAQVSEVEVAADVPLTVVIPDMVELAPIEPTFDLNNDGVVNSLDLSILIEKIGTNVTPTP